MPVYEQTYHHYTGTYLPRSQCWTVITQHGIKQAWRGKWFRPLLFFCLINFFIFAGRLYLAANIELMEFLGMNPNINRLQQLFVVNEAFFYQFLTFQFFACFLMTVVIGADLIAADRRTKAISLYLSKPITRLDYLFGKGGIVLFFLWGLTLIPGWLLMLLHSVFNEDWLFIYQNIPMVLNIFIYANAIVIPLVFLILTFSSLAKSRVTATVLFCVAYFLPGIGREILNDIFQNSSFSVGWFDTWNTALALQSIWEQIGRALFQQTEQMADLHWLWHWAVLIAVCVVCGAILRKQIRAVDIVK